MTQHSNGLPRHVAIIMDGNGRWAQRQGKPRTEGHSKGADAVREITRACRRLGVKALTLFAFSEQNWNRPVEEVEALMDLLRQYLLDERQEILENDIRLTTIGQTAHLPAQVREPLEELMAASAGNGSMILCLALSYGGREELIAAARELASRVQSGELDPASFNEELVAEHLWSAHLPPLDLLIRTSGEKRLSNFLLWHAAYAELYFTPTLWPDFSEADLREALESFRLRERRYGLTGEQIHGGEATED
ncbi:MAG: polyprenyl diphosphate synthase [Polyangia bacterium]|nr:polyprenyl diphosphate synthase [Polyangia bacterium]